jgi:hypothetical protein
MTRINPLINEILKEFTPKQMAERLLVTLRQPLLSLGA